jgi:hypothetical protein
VLKSNPSRETGVFGGKEDIGILMGQLLEMKNLCVITVDLFAFLLVEILI